MWKLIVVPALSAVLASTVGAASFTIDTLFTFQSTGANALVANPGFASRTLQIDTPDQDPFFSSTIVNGLPAAGESNSLSNPLNNTSYEVTTFSLLPLFAAYGISAQGGFSDSKSLNNGAGPVFSTGLELDQAPSGTVAFQIDNTVVGNGPGDVSRFTFDEEVVSSNLLIVRPISGLLQLDGEGQATWLGDQGVFASGSNYTLFGSLLYLQTGFPLDSWSVTVSNGIVTAETNSAINPVLLPAIGSLGSFEIALPIQSTAYSNGDPNTILQMSVSASSFSTDGVPFGSTLPEPSSILLTSAGCTILVIVGRKMGNA